MPGIPGSLLLSLRSTLAECVEFDTDGRLQTVFANELLTPWRDSLPEARNRMERVDAVISSLKDERRADTQMNILVLLLIVLRDLRDIQDARRTRLESLAEQLASVFQASASPGTSGVVEEANPENQPMLFTVELLELLKSISAVGKVNVPQVMQGKATQRSSSGTGWLIAPDLAVTCWHVMKVRGSLDGPLHDADLTAQVTNSVLTFDYISPGKGVDYQVDALECYDTALDYALLRLKDRTDSPLRSRGFLKLDIQLDIDALKPSQTTLYVIQHPKGQPQQSSSGRFVQLSQDRPGYILHRAPTEPGTSGAPVLNTTNWRVVAVHNSENQVLHLREATLLQAILPHIQQTRLDLYNTIMGVK